MYPVMKFCPYEENSQILSFCQNVRTLRIQNYGLRSNLEGFFIFILIVSGLIEKI